MAWMGDVKTVNQDEHTEVFQPVIQRAAHAPLQHNRFPGSLLSPQNVCCPHVGRGCDANDGIAKVTMARKLAVCLYWMWRKGWDYAQRKKFGSHAGEPGNRQGVR